MIDSCTAGTRMEYTSAEAPYQRFGLRHLLSAHGLGCCDRVLATD